MSVFDRQSVEDLEARILAPYAFLSAHSRGREAAEAPDAMRTEFQRDRDRILHSQAFRKLEYKTQVYVTHEGDFFRTRLTHTLEVAQIARTLARGLGLNGDLTEAIALAHDLGHTPFGHIGERVLNELLAECGGFEHNAQSLRVVEVLEDRFHDRPGLNLTWEVRAGIAQHTSAYDAPGANRYDDGLNPVLEAQTADLCDEIAYNHHDIDDALSMGLLTVEQLHEMDWMAAIWERARARVPAGQPERYVKFRALGGLMDAMVTDVIRTTGERLERYGIDSPDAVRRCEARLIGFSPEMEQRQAALRQFLMTHVYRHPTTLRMQNKAARFFRRLFELYTREPEMLPLGQQERLERWGTMRVVTDYLSGMTDRHCLEDYRAHFDPTPGWSR